MKKKYADGNCEECQMQNSCPAPRLNWCPEVNHGIVWEMNI